MVSKGLGLDWNRIARLHSQVMKGTQMNSLTASRCHIKVVLEANFPIFMTKIHASYLLK